MSDVLDFYTEWGDLMSDALKEDRLKAAREQLEQASTIAPTDASDAAFESAMIKVGQASARFLADPVNPPHYRRGDMELIDVIDGWAMDFYQGTIVQYLLRWRDKGGLEDLKKCRWYLNRYIANHEGK